MIKPYIAACVQPIVRMAENRNDIKRNLKRCEELIDFTAGYYWEWPCKLITFPEYFLHGVPTTGKGEKKRSDFLNVAIGLNEEEIGRLGEKAKEYNLYIAGGGIVEKVPEFPGYWFNTGVIIGPNGKIVLKYHKWQVPGFLGLATSPHDVFDRYKEIFGSDLKSLFPVVDTEIGKLGLYICYDGWQPEIARALAFNGGEVLVHPTAAPADHIEGSTDTWTLTNRARAHDNKVYVLAPNWGRIKYKYYPESFCPGKSQIVDYNGRVIAESPYPGESVIGAEIDIEALRRQRAKMSFNAWPNLRVEIFKEMYDHSIYPPNLFLDHPPESLAQKMEGQVKAFEYLYKKGILTISNPEEMPSMERVKTAQTQKTLKG